ncbi:MAG TPA: hypothetical protein VMW65_16165 [Chloroflexota bacterium]|nr:hypothetical protein [Chloroflexota bacterium]
MISSDREVRLDHEHMRRLVDIAATRGEPVTVVVGELIDQAYETLLAADRMRAAAEIGELSIEDVPDPETLSRQLAGAYESFS